MTNLCCLRPRSHLVGLTDSSSEAADRGDGSTAVSQMSSPRLCSPDNGRSLFPFGSRKESAVVAQRGRRSRFRRRGTKMNAQELAEKFAAKIAVAAIQKDRQPGT